MPRASASPTFCSTATSALALEPALNGVFRHAVHWTGAVSVDNPLALTQAYAARFAALGGMTLSGDARTLHRAEPYWRVDTAAGPIEAGDVVVALGPWTADIVSRSASNCRSRSNAVITAISVRTAMPDCRARCSIPRTVTCWRRWSRASALTTGVEFAARDARPTPVQLDRLLPAARELFPLGEPFDAKPWLGRAAVLSRTRGRSLDGRRASADCGSLTATRIGD